MSGKTRAVPDCLRNTAKLAEALGSSLHELRSVEANKEEHYTSFNVAKASGGFREITPPRKWLRCVHRNLLHLLTPIIDFPSYVCGGVPRKSIVAHARYHVAKLLLFTFDIRNFYGTTSRGLVVDMLSRYLPADCADLVASLCTFRGSLPQGSPTSMLLANSAFLPADREIRQLCKCHRLAYSRYVDDLAISGDHKFKKMECQLIEIVKSLGYDVAPEKVEWRYRHQRQVVTNLVVNHEIRPTREYYQAIKRDIQNCLQYGPELVADEQGLSVIRLKGRLNGQVNFVQTFHAKLGKKLRGFLFRVWQKAQTQSA